MPDKDNARVTMLWPQELKEAVREEVGARGLTTFVIEAVRAKLGTHDSHKEDSKELNEVKFLAQRLADNIAMAGDYEDRESTLRELDLPPWIETTGWPEHLARAINPEESTPEPVEHEPLERSSTAFEQRPPGSVYELPEGTDLPEVREALADHHFEGGYSGATCARMVERDGGGDQCGLPPDAHPIRPQDDEDLHRPMFMTPKKPEPEGPGVGDNVLKEAPRSQATLDLLARVQAKAAEKGVDISGIGLKPASEVESAPAGRSDGGDAGPQSLDPAEADAIAEKVMAENQHNHSWKRLDDPHGLYSSNPRVCDCGATMDSKGFYEFGKVPGPATESAPELQSEPDAASADVCPKCGSPLVAGECWTCF